MGVPSFYRWLVEKYPSTVCEAQRNPNSSEQEDYHFDNLFLDMNGIIHPCFHPEDSKVVPPSTFEDVFKNIYEYIDKVFDIVRPCKLLMLAIDGVAPRAKMNQQRSRRFKTAKDSQQYEELEIKFKKEFELKGKMVLPREETELDDFNVITPGTEFMNLLSKKLQCYIKLKMSNDPLWKTIKVILSDANVPGEGEHKIMSFIRAQRCSEGYDPNTRHCLYGLDADLIMLALATHEVHFSILREVVDIQEPMPVSHNPQWTSGLGESSKCDEPVLTPAKTTRFQFLKVWLLREYLDIDMHISEPPTNVRMDLERIIDDFIFICFFTGNDFLPHMPTLEIHEGAIDLLIHVYKNEFKNLGGYLVDIEQIEDKKNGFIKLGRVERFIISVGKYEEMIFKKRTDISEKKLRRILSQMLNDVEDECETELVPSSNFSEKESCTDVSELLNNTKELKDKVKGYIRSQSDTFKSGAFSDKVKLASIGFKQRYYAQKFSAESLNEIECMRKELVQKYTEGLVWVLKYYFSGVPSWNWFYPYHYGPFASDLKGLAQVKVQFQKSLPLKPYDQLLAVLPPRSAHALPAAYRKLMVDEDSSISDFYPTDFEMDVDGKRFMWKAVCKLPFIDEFCLLKETKRAEEELKEHEKARNEEKSELLFVGGSSPLGELIQDVYKSQNIAIKIDSKLIDGLNGELHLCEESEEIEALPVVCISYKLPSGCKYQYHLLEGVTIPEKTVTEDGIAETKLWHECNSYNTVHIGAGRGRGRSGHMAGDGWGRGRGRFDDSCPSSLNSRLQEQAGSWRDASANATATWRPSRPNREQMSRGRGRGRFDDYCPSSLNSRLEEQCKLSEAPRPINCGTNVAWTPRHAVSAGSWRGTTAAWRPSYPNTEQKSNGRGSQLYVHQASPAAWTPRHAVSAGSWRGTTAAWRPSYPNTEQESNGRGSQLYVHQASPAAWTPRHAVSAGSWRGTTAAWRPSCPNTEQESIGRGSQLYVHQASPAAWTPRHAVSAGSWRGTTAAWRPSYPNTEQESNGRGTQLYVHQASPAAWNVKNGPRNTNSDQ